MEQGKLVVVGQGYVGTPVAVRAAEVGWNVVGYDTDEARVEQLNRGVAFSPDVEDDRLKAALDGGAYYATSDHQDCAGFEYCVLTVPTPLRDYRPDLSFIERAAHDLARYITPGCTVILESTTRPGTTEEILVPLLEAGSGITAGSEFHVGYSPERLDPGNSVWRFENTPKIVSGIDPESAQRVASFYDTLVDSTVPVSGTREAELTKLLENTFRQVNIALINELAILSRRLRINFWEVLDAASTKPFGYMRFNPGPGVGGHCIPIDPSYLSWYVRSTLGESCRFAELANEINARMPEYVVQRCTLKLNSLGRSVHGSVILLLGLAYKPDVGDIRESPALRVAELLRGLGARVRICEPYLDELTRIDSYTYVEFCPSSLQESDLTVVLTNHAVFDADAIVQFARQVLDTRNCLPNAGHVEVL